MSYVIFITTLPSGIVIVGSQPSSINLSTSSVLTTLLGVVLLEVELEKSYKNKVGLKFSIFDSGIGIKKEASKIIFNSLLSFLITFKQEQPT